MPAKWLIKFGLNYLNDMGTFNYHAKNAYICYCVCVNHLQIHACMECMLIVMSARYSDYDDYDNYDDDGCGIY